MGWCPRLAGEAASPRGAMMADDRRHRYRMVVAAFGAPCWYWRVMTRDAGRRAAPLNRGVNRKWEYGHGTKHKYGSAGTGFHFRAQ
jgi:hypothetical protein